MAEWKPFDLTWGRSIYYCSECEESVDLPTAMGKPIYKYCPMCGAKMNTDRKTEPMHDLRTETHECVKDTHDKTELTICDFCRYYNSYIPCGSTPSACKKADKFAEEFAVALMKLKPQTERGGE